MPLHPSAFDLSEYDVNEFVGQLTKCRMGPPSDEFIERGQKYFEPSATRPVYTPPENTLKIEWHLVAYASGTPCDYMRTRECACPSDTMSLRDSQWKRYVTAFANAGTPFSVNALTEGTLEGNFYIVRDGKERVGNSEPYTTKPIRKTTEPVAAAPVAGTDEIQSAIVAVLDGELGVMKTTTFLQKLEAELSTRKITYQRTSIDSAVAALQGTGQVEVSADSISLVAI